MRTRTFFVVALLASLLVAGGVSYFASTNPDGLEFVAEKVGFDHAAEDSAATGSPLSDYQVRGVENDALSGGLAGVVGALVVLVVAGGLAYVVRRRGTGSSADPEADNTVEAAEPDATTARADGEQPAGRGRA